MGPGEVDSSSEIIKYMKKALLSLALIPALFGCSTGGNNNLAPSLVRVGVATGVSYGALKYPKSVPGVRIAGEVICSAANGTNLSPASVIEAIHAASPNISPETTLIVNGALVLYIGVWNSYGQSAVNNQPNLKLYLKATCDGINDGLLPQSAAKASTESSTMSWPLLRAK